MKTENRYKPAVIAVGYNRPKSLCRLLNSLEEAYYPEKEVTLIVSLDHSDMQDKMVSAVEQTAWTHGQRIICTHEQKLGLKKHILECGSRSEEYGAVIILEDDLVVGKDFYNYTVQALNFYGDRPEIAGISLYSHAWNEHGDYHFMPQQNGYDTYLGQFSCTWGQCWTDCQWNRFCSWYSMHEDSLRSNPEIPKDIENWGDRSWGKYFVYYMVEKQLYYVLPYISMSTNCSELGEHNGVKNPTYQVMLSDAVNRTFQFADPEQAVKYDIFFERVLDNTEICGIPVSDICMNLNGLKRITGSRNYLLTTVRNRKFRLIRTFGMQFRPIESNVLRDCEGDDIYLYQVSDTHENISLTPKGDHSLQRSMYEIYNSGWRRSFQYFANDFSVTLKHLITRK